MRLTQGSLLFCCLLATVVSAQTPDASPTVLPQAQLGHPYEVRIGLEVSGTYPFTFARTGKLPVGLNMSDSGLLSGNVAPQPPADFAFTVVVTDAHDKKTSAKFILSVSKGVPLYIAPTNQKPPSPNQPQPAPAPQPPAENPPSASDPVSAPDKPAPQKTGGTVKLAVNETSNVNISICPTGTTASNGDCVKSPTATTPKPADTSVKPSLNTVLGKGISYLSGRAEPSVLAKGSTTQYQKEVRISITSCTLDPTPNNWPRPPALVAIECSDRPRNSLTAPNLITPLIQSLSITNGPNNQGNYVITDKDGAFAVNLETPITCHKAVVQYLSVEAYQVSNKPISSDWYPACNNLKAEQPSHCDRAYNDCDEGFSVIAGIEQAGLSSQQSQTDAFIRVFTRAPTDAKWGSVWGTIRFLGAPEASSTANVISATADPTGVLVTKNFVSVGNAIDYIAGYQWDPGFFHNYKHGGQYSIGVIAGLGATTPLSAQNLVLAYQVPPLNTTECGQLQQRFTAKNGYNPAPTPGDATNNNTSCLFNTAGITSPSQNAGTPVTTLAFTNQDRSNFLLKYGIGVRATTRFHTGEYVVCGEPAKYDPGRGPCVRGVIDFTLGQDEAITGGYLRHFVFKIDGVHPLPFGGGKFLYVFGNASIRTTRNLNFPPLILQSGSLDSLTKAGPAASVFVLPLKQPDRDFYRFGVGLNLTQIFSKLSNTATNPKPSSPPSPNPQSSTLTPSTTDTTQP